MQQGTRLLSAAHCSAVYPCSSNCDEGSTVAQRADILHLPTITKQQVAGMPDLLYVHALFMFLYSFPPAAPD